MHKRRLGVVASDEVALEDLQGNIENRSTAEERDQNGRLSWPLLRLLPRNIPRTNSKYFVAKNVGAAQKELQPFHTSDRSRSRSLGS